MGRFELPAAPADQSGPVKVWSQPVTIPTYEPEAPDLNPMFLERRVYQGSSGRVYPLPFFNRIREEKRDRAWEAVHLENEYLRVMVLPEIGGRIHIGMDKTNGYDFFYRQNVIKPALVGLGGPWASGGVEFNWPQHHRPSTYMRTDVSIERHADGSMTAWFSEHDPMNRTKGMHGVCLHPGKALLELKVRLYNRTQLVQSFLFWANVGVRVHEHFQSFFPPDVHYVADHARRAMSTFPLCQGSYYGVDYGSRTRLGIPPEQFGPQFPPTGEYAPNDLSRYANIPVPTSYMAMGSSQDFVGGYDHAKQAGLVHVASHHISPGKKQWTWGNHPFGYAWDRNLTDEDGPYVELMAGVYTDNQPDFSFMGPGETRTWSQYWYPIQRIGPVQQASREAAVSLRTRGKVVRVGIAVTSVIRGATVRVEGRGAVLREMTAELAPDRPWVEEVEMGKCAESDLRVSLRDAAGREVIAYQPAKGEPGEAPEPATEPALPADVESSDELYLIGLHLDQYRHATRPPELYWREALRRDPLDSRCNNAMGLYHFRRGEDELAAEHFERAIQRLTRRNPNPYDGEPYYNLGLVLRRLGREEEAYAAFYKATWNWAWQSASFYALAEMDCRRQRWDMALEHLDRALKVNADHLQGRNLKVMVLRKLGRRDEAESLLKETMELDPLDFFAQWLAGKELACDTQVRIDVALDLERAGFVREAIGILSDARPEAGSGTAPLVAYHRAVMHDAIGEREQAEKARTQAAAAPPDYCFPARAEEIAVLEAAMRKNPKDARAPYYLGNLFYDRRRQEEAIACWERAARLDPGFSIVWRNLGIAYFNVCHEPEQAKRAYDKAIRSNPEDPRLLYERDQLWKRLGETPQRRLAELERRLDLVARRDDLTLELCELYNQTDRPERALELLRSRRFQPWEGGEGLARGQHVRTHLALGRRALEDGNPTEAKRLFEAALDTPENLGEAAHALANLSEIHYWAGVACEGAGERKAPREHWTQAAESRGDFQEMSVRAYSEMSYFAGMALEALGRKTAAKQLLRQVLAYAKELEKSRAKIDYFATSLPTMLLFEDDLQKRQEISARFLAAQAKLGLGDRAGARRLLQQVLRDDPNHPRAGEFLALAAAAAPARRKGAKARV